MEVSQGSRSRRAGATLALCFDPELGIPALPLHGTGTRGVLAAVVAAGVSSGACFDICIPPLFAFCAFQQVHFRARRFLGKE